MLTAKDKEQYFNVLMALWGFDEKVASEETKRGKSDDNIKFHGTGVESIPGAVQFRGE